MMGPERAIRKLHEHLVIESILDVGAGHGGVFDKAHWDARLHNIPTAKKEACDIEWIRPMEGGWTTKLKVDACNLTASYPEKSFDLVQCFECLEHVPDPRRALEEMIKVARKLVIMTSADEAHHTGPEQDAIEKVNPFQKYIKQPSVADLRDLGFEVRMDLWSNRQLIAWKVL